MLIYLFKKKIQILLILIIDLKKFKILILMKWEIMLVKDLDY